MSPTPLILLLLLSSLVHSNHQFNSMYLVSNFT